MNEKDTRNFKYIGIFFIILGIYTGVKRLSGLFETGLSLSVLFYLFSLVVYLVTGVGYLLKRKWGIYLFFAQYLFSIVSFIRTYFFSQIDNSLKIGYAWAFGIGFLIMTYIAVFSYRNIKHLE